MGLSLRRDCQKGSGARADRELFPETWWALTDSFRTDDRNAKVRAVSHASVCQAIRELPGYLSGICIRRSFPLAGPPWPCCHESDRRHRQRHSHTLRRASVEMQINAGTVCSTSRIPALDLQSDLRRSCCRSFTVIHHHPLGILKIGCHVTQTQIRSLG